MKELFGGFTPRYCIEELTHGSHARVVLEYNDHALTEPLLDAVAKSYGNVWLTAYDNEAEGADAGVRVVVGERDTF